MNQELTYISEQFIQQGNNLQFIQICQTPCIVAPEISYIFTLQEKKNLRTNTHFLEREKQNKVDDTNYQDENKGQKLKF